jgi:cytochrome c556
MSKMSRFSRPAARVTAVAVAVAAVGGAFAPVSSAQQAPGAQWIKYRQAVYTVLGTNFGVVGRMAAGRQPYDAKAASAAADRIALMATTAPEVFPADSQSGAPTKAKPEIWTGRADFDGLMKNMGEKTAALAAAAKTNNLDNVKAAFGEAQKTCKACHDKYKLD